MSTSEQHIEELNILALTKDLRAAAATLGPREARYLVDLYYQMQDYRIATNNQARSMGDEEPHATVTFFAQQMSTLEKQVLIVLDKWSAQQEIAQWARGQKGIGPVLSAGLLAHIDLHRIEYAGQLWSYAGLSPLSKWEKGQKRPWNAELKKLCWKIGESFMKVSGYDDAFYGKVYAQRKEYELKRNEEVWLVPSTDAIQSEDTKGTVVRDGEIHSCFLLPTGWYAGGNAQAAFEKLARYKIGKETDAYKAYSCGKLPPAHILSRAKRYAVKLFLAHYFEQGCRIVKGVEPPGPYAIDHLGHVGYIPAPA